MKDIRIRPATFGDAQVLIDFNSAMALETEDKQLLPEVIGAGVRRLLEQPASGFYVIAEADARPVAAPELAARDPGVCGFRLYVERENHRAQAAYRTLGMNETRYLVFEELKPGVRFFK